MAEEVRSMFASIASRYDTGNTVLSLGIHHLWRKATVNRSIATAGMKVLDCATGTGDLALEFKTKVGLSGTVVGTDFCSEMLEYAPAKAKKEHLDVTFEIADAMDLPYEDNSFDIASIAFGIRNVDSPEQCLQEMARVVRPGGQVVVLEFGQPSGIFSWPYNFYSQYLLPRLGSLVTGNKKAYTYLHTTSANFPCGQDFINLMHKTQSFTKATYHPLTFGVAFLYLGTVAAATKA